MCPFVFVFVLAHTSHQYFVLQYNAHYSAVG